MSAGVRGELDIHERSVVCLVEVNCQGFENSQMLFDLELDLRRMEARCQSMLWLTHTPA